MKNNWKMGFRRRGLVALGAIFLALVSARTVFSQTRAATDDPGLSDPFVAVFVDDKTEQALGPFPYDRSYYATALKVIRASKARAVVIKFFLDQPKPGPGDDRLADEMGKIPCLLEARLDPRETKPNPLPDRFDRSKEVFLPDGGKGLWGGDGGWIPLGKFSGPCAGIGFVDIESSKDVLRIPMFERYRGMVLPSLELAALETAFGKTGKVVWGRELDLDGHALKLDRGNDGLARLPAKDMIQSISFFDLLDENFPKDRLKDKIVVLGFDSQRTPTLPTPQGPMRIHRLFFYSLESLYEQLEVGKPGMSSN